MCSGHSSASMYHKLLVAGHHVVGLQQVVGHGILIDVVECLGQFLELLRFPPILPGLLVAGVGVGSVLKTRKN